MLKHERFLHTADDKDRKCEILSKSMIYDLNDKEYPEEWTVDEKNNPFCTNYCFWDWDNDGNPDDPQNPKAPVPYDPNQLVMPFLTEELESILTEKGYQIFE